MQCSVCDNSCDVLHHYFYSGLAHYPRTGKKPESEWAYYAPLYHITLNKGKDIVPFCGPECSTEYTKNVDNRA